MSEAKTARTVNLRRLVIYLLIVVVIGLFIARVISITAIFNIVLLQPILNFLVLMSRYFLGNFGLAIIVLTIIIRLLTFPLIIRQFRSSRTMQSLQPKVQELQRKYGKDQQKLGQEVMKLYREHGVNPIGCYPPALLQVPIWLALYVSVVQALAYSPENLLGLERQLYSPWLLQNTVPLKDHFLWLNLTQGNIGMAFAEGISIWILLKMSSPVSVGAQQQTMQRVLMWGMPLLFGFMAFVLPSGLSLYWVVSNVIGIILQYPLSGWGSLKMPSLSRLKRGAPQPVGKPSAKTRGVARVGNKAGKAVAPKQGGVKADVASSKREAAGGSTVSGGDVGGHEEHRSEGKD
jgi:YidC/Oxa1 family membrane protein insertase